MKIFAKLLFLTLWAAVQSEPFSNENRKALFGIARGGKISKKVSNEGNPTAFPQLVDDYDNAERQIFDAIGKLERNMEKVMEAEVDTLFHELKHHDKVEIKKKAQQAVKKGAKKVKTDIGHQTQPSLPEAYHYPYDWPNEDPDHRLLHAIEHAEKAVMHAVEAEVNGLFHGLDNQEEHHEHKKALSKGVSKGNKYLDEAHQSRRSWFTTDRGSKEKLEDYIYCWAIQ
ncbi:MAG: hypothetical protein SGBAC_002208 [Bacillariaceae sp.]